MLPVPLLCWDRRPPPSTAPPKPLPSEGPCGCGEVGQPGPESRAAPACLWNLSLWDELETHVSGLQDDTGCLPVPRLSGFCLLGATLRPSEGRCTGGGSPGLWGAGRRAQGRRLGLSTRGQHAGSGRWGCKTFSMCAPQGDTVGTARGCR